MNGIRERLNLQSIVPIKSVAHPIGIRKGSMPELGEIKRGTDIGLKRSNKVMWHACIYCGKESWRSIRNGKVQNVGCLSCQCRRRRFISTIPLGTIDAPIIGDVRTAGEIGKGIGAYIYSACERCGKTRWILMQYFKRGKVTCKQCATRMRFGNTSIAQGTRTKQGYIILRVDIPDFFKTMCRKEGSIFEHRLIMARYLGRCLAPFESVHHKNGIKDDNRVANLELGTRNTHSQDHGKGYRDGYLKGLNDGHLAQIAKLKNQIKILQECAR